MASSTRFTGLGSSYLGTWTNPTNIYAIDSTYATAANSVNGTSYFGLQATTFGFSIPSGATIDGIELTITRHASKATTYNRVYDANVYVMKDTSNIYSKTANATNWPTTDADRVYGGSTDLWGTTWTPTQINASTFGARLRAAVYKTTGGDATTTAYVDAIKITVYYTYAGVQNSQFLVFFP